MTSVDYIRKKTNLDNKPTENKKERLRRGLIRS
jgi:hypothetical protein